MTEKERKVLEEAQKRFKQCVDFEDKARVAYLKDIKFANADADNGYQWPTDVMQNRQVENRPCLTINKVRQHCLQIMNDARQNKPAIKIRAVGDGATVDSAQTYEGVIRRIEYNSNAQSAYDTATKFQVQGGIGYFYICTDYVDNDSFDQEIFIKPVRDPLTVYMDPAIKQADGSDARFAFVFEDCPRDKFEEEYPEFKDIAGATNFDGSTTWSTKDTVRIAEYYRIKEKKVQLVAYELANPDTGEMETKLVRADTLPPEIRRPLMDDKTSRVRPIKEKTVEWYKIVGNEIVEKTVIPCIYIPICRVVGEETIIEGVLDRKGHTRAMKDPQRMYNYHSSGAVEYAAMQNKAPYVGPLRAFEGLENTWKLANVKNFPYLPYNDIDDEGKEIAPPQRAEPPATSPAAITLLQLANDELESVSGQREAQMGQSTNDQSGRALNALQRKGDNATYHFIDNLGLAIRFAGKILIDMIPRVYDTPRVMRILAEDGTETEVQVDPEAEKAFIANEEEREARAAAIFNPKVGKYDVMADVGPAYATRRQEAFDAISQVITGAPEAMAIAGDLLFKAADFPMAKELAERWRRMVPAQALGEGPTQTEQALTAENQQLKAALEQTVRALADKAKEHQIEDLQKEIDIYKAETERMKALEAGLKPEAVAALTAQLVLQALQNGAPTPDPVEPTPTMPEPPQMAAE